MLLIVAQLEAVVGLVTCTVIDSLPARSRDAQVRVLPEMVQFAELPEATDQLMPVPVGRMSESTTPLATPSPIFVRVIE